MNNPIPLPIHFKLPGRSYSQIGRKGNVALYSVYSDYLIIPDFALPYLLIGYELVAIKIKNGREVYPTASQFGESAWSIPKSFPRDCFTRFRSCAFGFCRLLRCSLKTFLDRSPASEASADLAQCQPQTDQKAAKEATIEPQRRVTLR